jgi:MutS-like protein
MSVPPGDEYRARLADRRATFATLSRQDARFSTARLATFGVGAALLIAWWRGWLGAAWLALPAAAFVVLIQRHDLVVRARSAAQRSIQFYERGLARIDDRWAGTGEAGDRFRDDRHLYANDLDIFGRGSLFELLSLARTRAGEEALAAWLTHPAASQEVGARRDAVTELAPALDLREALSLAGSDVAAGVDSSGLVTWAEGSAILSGSWRRAAAALLTAGIIGAALYWWATGDYGYFATALVVEILFSIPQRRSVQRALHSAEAPARDLDILAHVLARLERETFTTARLNELRRRLDTEGVPASRAIGRLHWLVELHDWQHNQFFAPIGAALLWGTHLAWAIEAWRRVHGAHVRSWLRTVGEFEALSSLSAYRFEHPDDVWPDIVEGAATFDGASIGHPLLPAAKMVRNDVHLNGDTRLLVISGSNMSGKSTLLRTVGINGVLALAGAPVRATRLLMTPLAIGATLRIQDSLQEGRSRFYAEITRIRELADLARGPEPLLFLLDEIFHGTNSHDRLVGATGVLRSLLDRGAIGLITTHDLALTAIADSLSTRAANMHFEDRFEGGEIVFEFRMKPGPVTRSNALALMRSVGLDIGSDGTT